MMRSQQSAFGLISRLFVVLALCLSTQPGYWAAADDKNAEKSPATDTAPAIAEADDKPASEAQSADEKADEKSTEKDSKPSKSSKSKKATTKKRTEVERKSSKKQKEDETQTSQPKGSQPRGGSSGLPTGIGGGRGRAVAGATGGDPIRPSGVTGGAGAGGGAAQAGARGGRAIGQEDGAAPNAKGPDPKLVQRVMDVQNKHTPDLLKQNGIVGTATGLDKAGNVVIKVYTSGAGNPKIPETLDGISVDVVMRGLIFSYSGFAGSPQYDPQTRLSRPIPIGVSGINLDTNCGSACATGTIGCRLRAKDGSGKLFALSNNHVFAGNNQAAIGTPIVQPGPADNGCNCVSSDEVGKLVAFYPKDYNGGFNRMDAAIISTTANLISNATLPDGYGLPRGTTVKRAYLGQKVMKYGRTTGFTKGVVIGVNAIEAVISPGIGVALYSGQIDVTGVGGTFGGPGDSGSLVLDENRFPLGLLFAGGGQITILNQIQEVLDYFDLEIDGDDSTDFVPPGKITEAVPDVQKGLIFPLGTGSGGGFGGGLGGFGGGFGGIGGASGASVDPAKNIPGTATGSGVRGGIGTGPR